MLILPDLPPSSRSDKQKEVDREYSASVGSFAPSPSPPSTAEAWSPLDAPVPTYVERSEHDPGESLPPPPLAPAAAGSSSQWHLPPPPLDYGASHSPSTLPPSPGGGTLSAADVPYAMLYPTDVDEEGGGEEEEYDGYEELSLPATLSTRLPPPAIDDDVSPPSVGEPSSVAGLALAAARGRVVDARGGGDARSDGVRERDEEGEAGGAETPPPDDFAPYDPPPPLVPPPPPPLADLDVPGAYPHADKSAPPPSFDPRAPLPPPSDARAAEPASPPPHIDFRPLPFEDAPTALGAPSTLPERAPDDREDGPDGPDDADDADPPPPASGLPPPYFGSPPRGVGPSPGSLPPLPALAPAPASGADAPRGRGDARPPPYEQRDGGEGMGRGRRRGVGSRGEEERVL